MKSFIYTLEQGVIYGNEVDFKTKSLFDDVNTRYEDKLVIYPNPVINSFTIRGLSGLKHIELFDLQGYTVLNKFVNEHETVSVAELPRGIYLIKITNIEGVMKFKLIKD